MINVTILGCSVTYSLPSTMDDMMDALPTLLMVEIENGEGRPGDRVIVRASKTTFMGFVCEKSSDKICVDVRSISVEKSTPEAE